MSTLIIKGRPYSVQEPVDKVVSIIKAVRGNGMICLTADNGKTWWFLAESIDVVGP